MVLSSEILILDFFKFNLNKMLEIKSLNKLFEIFELIFFITIGYL